MAKFSVTDIGTFRRCRRKWDYSSKARRNLMAVGSGPEELELGGLIHRALADWITEKNQSEVKLDGIFAYHALKRQEEIKQKFQEVHRREIPDHMLDPLHNVVKLGISMMQNYQEYHKTPLPANMVYAYPEQEVEIPVPGTEHQCPNCINKRFEVGNTLRAYYRNDSVVGEVFVWLDCEVCNGTGIEYHYLTMTLDGLLQDKKRRLWILEHKTYSNRPQKIDLFMNDQFTKYSWGTSQLKLGTVAGVAYDGMWKRPSPPKYLQTERRAGTMADLFIREPVVKTPEEIVEAGRIIALEINEMASNPAIYPNVPWQGCKSEKCAFIDVCRMQSLGEDYQQLLNVNFVTREVIRGGHSEDTASV